MPFQNQSFLAQSLLSAITKYEGLSDDPDANKALMNIERKLQYFVGYLKKHDDFNALDRLFVLTEFVNPLYAELYNFHKSLQIEFSDEADPTPNPTNYHALNFLIPISLIPNITLVYQRIRVILKNDTNWASYYFLIPSYQVTIRWHVLLAISQTKLLLMESLAAKE